MIGWKNLICGVTIGVGGIGAVALIPSYVHHWWGGQLTKPKTYKWDCYKWIIDRKTAGELAVCQDARIPTQTNPSIIFVLWWLKKGDSDYNKFLEVDSIKLESDSQILFVLKSKSSQSEKKLIVDEREKPKLNKLNTLNSVSLKDNCKLDLSSGGVPQNLNCSSGGYTASVEHVTWWFRLRN